VADAAQTAGSAPGAVSQARETLSRFTRRWLDPQSAGEPVDLAEARRVAADDELIDPAAFEGTTPEQQARILDEADQGRVGKVRAWGEQLMRDGKLTPEDQASMQQAMSNLGDRASQAFVASKKVAADGLRAATEQLSGLDTKITPIFDKLRGAVEGDTKRSDMSEGVRNAVNNVVGPILRERQPELLSNPDAMNKLADSMRKVLAVAESGHALDDVTLGHLQNVFGEDTRTVLTELHAAVGDGENADAARNFFKTLNRVSDVEDQQNTLRQIVQSNLSEDVAGDYTPRQYGEVVDNIRSFLDGNATKNMPAEQAQYTTRLFHERMGEVFGDKTDAVLKAFQDDASARNKGAQDLDALRSEDGHVQTQGAADALDSQYIGGKGHSDEAPAFMPSDAAHRAAAQRAYDANPDPRVAMSENQSQADRLLGAAKQRHPDKDVSFVSAREYAQRRGLDDAELQRLTKGANPDEVGLIAVDQTKDEFRVSPDEAKSAMFDERKAKQGQAKEDMVGRVPLGDGKDALDALAVTRLGRQKLAGEYSDADEKGGLHRIGRAFMEGLGGVQRALGRDDLGAVPDNTVIAYQNGEPVRYKDIKGLSYRPTQDAGWMKGKTDAEINSLLRQREVLPEMSTKELNNAHTSMEKTIAKREEAVRAQVEQWKADNVRFGKEDVRELYRPVNAAKESLALIQNELDAREFGTAAERAADGAPQDPDPQGQIHTAAARLGEKGIQQKVDMAGQSTQKSTRAEPAPLDGEDISPTRKAALDSGINKLESRSITPKQQATKSQLAAGEDLREMRKARDAAGREGPEPLEVTERLKAAVATALTHLRSLRTDNGKVNLIARAVADKARALYDNWDTLSALDRRVLSDVFADKTRSVSTIGPTVNGLF
jgi:hypothetical protein